MNTIIYGLEKGASTTQSKMNSSNRIDVDYLYKDWIHFCAQCLPIQPWNNNAKISENKDSVLMFNSKEKESSEELRQSECTDCGKTFKNVRGLKQHIGKVHSNCNKVWICTCGSAFKNKYALKTHKKQVHKGMDRVECPVCNKLIYNKYILKKHLLLLHY